MILKIIGAVIAIWLAFALLGVLFSALKVLLIVAGVVTIGVLGYGAIKTISGGSQKQIR
ncbi:hypothetical protein EV191_103211 [Tamaricihabitans halophyticus]|uniref:Uncharacterized protein n=1 Tax=Tamaricihabitans halophyticus TaxID=1262583 RepID=A0A4R2QVR6_9PSEU|nr:hypothetical protein [Tamaricihabitans halophyticus]TCP54170.1 hypothetical protein EV191_103211 [Tamaricihabitans halophyticus]